MASIDNRFIVTSDVDTYYVDKDTGFPLAGGIVTFYSDVNRTVLKPVYQLTGSPGFYTYSPLPNPCILSSVGTFQDAIGNNIVPYYFPYEGTPDDTNNVVELYYITVESSGNVPQLTRQAWPNNVAGSSGQDRVDLTNYIPNGQFLTHTDIIETLSGINPPFTTQGSILTQPIAQGGWSFNHSVAGVSTFNNSFVKIISLLVGLDDFPGFAFNFQCTSFSTTDSIRDLTISWPDVNKFSRETTLQPFTFTIAATSNDAGTYNFDVRLIRYYGTGGSPSPTSDQSIGIFTITPGYQYFSAIIPNILGNLGIIGNNNDDSISISIRGPSSDWNIQTTDWSFIPGDVAITATPIQTNAEMLAQSLPGWLPTPNPDGSDLFLKPVLTLQGMTWDDSAVGDIVTKLNNNGFTGSIHNTTNLLIGDGNSYVTSDYSPLGIPYKRLWAYLWDETKALPITGTGIDFVSCYNSGATNAIRLTTNQFGVQSATIDGTSPTGFTFSTLFTGTPSIDMIGNLAVNGNTVILQSTIPGVGYFINTWATSGTSGFSVTVLYPASGACATFFSYLIEVPALPGAGTYFTFLDSTASTFYVWFTVDGSGSDPAPGGTGILVPLLSGYTTYDCASLIREACSSFQASYIQTVAASAMIAPCYFQFSANGVDYIVSYFIDGIGQTFNGGTNIYVSLSSSDSDAQVAAATLYAINSYQFATPDLKDMILRGVNPGLDVLIGQTVTDRNLRFSLTNFPNSQGYGTYQYSDNRDHNHDVTISPQGPFSQFYIDGADPGALNAYMGIEESAYPGTINSNPQGGSESRPVNFGVLYAIRY